ncbi:Pentatricopeptide repeat-containing protein, mitochondrial [Trametes pubescens]|uniref:Pentatricopeptide repeat-containing protein, mitochondrial n=1 Tax=Trametes pubescens TaxID=154538 RepID=A0A1M2VRA1_TRAPU|nr:Pentatricopeptide repeat-containing protein, mitochondrial [Trametes pubescens]
MLSVIKDGQPRVALAIYDQYFHELRQRNLAGGTESERSSAVADEVMASDAESSATLNHVRDEILVAAIAAHAQLGSFADAMQTYLKAGIRTTFPTLVDTVRRLHPDRALHTQLKSYIFRLRTAGLLARPPTLMKHLANLTRDSADISLEQLYTTAITGASEPDPWLAITPDQLTGTRVVLLPDFFWASFLSSFLACHRADLAEKLWDDLLKLKVKPTIAVWNALLDGYGHMRSLDATLKTWEVMCAQGVKPDALSHRALISAFFTAGKPDEALGRFRAFERSYLTDGTPADPSGVMAVYNTTLHGLLFHLNEQDAKAIKMKMEQNGPSPDIITYNTFIRYYGRKGELKAMAEVLKELERAGVKADVYTFSTLLSSLLKVRPDADQIVLNFMKKHDVLPDTTALTAIIDHQLRECSPQNLKVAMDLMAKMERGDFGDAVPNVITYTSVLTAMNRGNWLPRSVVEDYTKQILDTMQNRDLKPNRQTYNVLIKAALSGFEPEGLESAMKYYRDMLRLRVHMNSDTWYLLLKGLMDRKRWDVAGEVVKDMRRLHASNLSSSLKKLVDIISRQNASSAGRA